MVTLRRRNRLFNLSVPLYAVYSAAAALFLLLVLGGLLGRLFVTRLTDTGELDRLSRENATLKEKVVAYTAAMDTFKEFLATTEKMDNKIRAAINLYLIPSDIRLMGIGGNQAPSPEPRVDNLLRRIRFEQQSLQEIEAEVRSQESRLTNMPSIWPVQGWVTSAYGYRHDPFTGRRTMHEGIDIVAPGGATIVAAASGRVVYAGWKSGWGRVVEIDHGYGMRTFYAHCRSIRVNSGATVSRGDAIATVGSSGRATGTHLHYGITVSGSWVNPRNYIISPAG